MNLRWVAIFMMVTALYQGGMTQDLRGAYRQANPSVVVVHAQQRMVLANNIEPPKNLESVGSGVLVTADGKILTAAHVVQTADVIDVELHNNRRIKARIIAVAPYADVALLQLDQVPDGVLVAKLGDSDLAEAGDQIFAIGSPFGAGHSLSVGWLSARRETENVFENLTALEVFQVDMALYEGNSGGPVFNMRGEVIGLVSHAMAKMDGRLGPSFAVTSNVARKLMLEQKRTWMGVEAMLLAGKLATSFNLSQSAGLLVQSVAEGSLGARLGLQEGQLRIVIEDNPMLIGGDIIVEILGQPVIPSAAILNQVQKQLDQLRSGDNLTVKVIRSGQEKVLTTVITE